MSGCMAGQSTLSAPSQPLSLPCRLDSRSAQNALLIAAHRSQWQLRETGHRRYRAIRREGDASATIAVSFDGRRYHATYLDSNGMGYDGSHIDGRYDRWRHAFDIELRNALEVACHAASASSSEISVFAPASGPSEPPLAEPEILVESVPDTLMKVN